MNKYCKGCVSHHNAKHKNPTEKLKKFNDWCCKIGQPAVLAEGHCKLQGLKSNILIPK